MWKQKNVYAESQRRWNNQVKLRHEPASRMMIDELLFDDGH
jgi:hypothetical protein